MKVVTEVGPTQVSITAGMVVQIFPDRRMATVQRRARGLGANRWMRRIGDPLLGSVQRCNPDAPCWGRRAGDKEAHEERRRAPESIRASDRVTGVILRRRKGDERRTKGREWTYLSSPDPRVRALERRHVVTATTVGEYVSDENKKLMGTCTENECRLCRVPPAQRLPGQFHAGIPLGGRS